LAIAPARLGHRCRRLGFVSDDSLGDFIVAQQDAAFVHGKLRAEATAVEVLVDVELVSQSAIGLRLPMHC